MKQKLTDEEKKKLASRKFLVWVVWLFILIGILALCIVVAVFTKEANDSTIELLTNAMDSFFIISITYLGANVLQKGVFAFKDYKITKREEDKCEQ